VPIVARRAQGIDALRRAIELLAVSRIERPADLPQRGASLEALAGWAEHVTAETSTGPTELSSADVVTERMDRYLTHPLYGMAVFIAVMCSLFLCSGHALKGRARPMILELPSYRVPSFRNAVLTAKDQGVAFLRTAGSIIMAICVVMWWLNAYPKVPAPAEAQALRSEAAQLVDAPEQAAALRARADVLQTKAEQAGSFAGRFGQFVQPVFAPLGFDWQLTVGVVTSFLAREVFVSTMSVLEGGAGNTGVDEGAVARIRGMTRADGNVLFTPSTATAALIFFVLAMQCLPTLAVTRKETARLKYAGLQLAYMSSLAYVVAFGFRLGLRMIGVP
jgi:ferrous iron transport protein B